MSPFDAHVIRFREWGRRRAGLVAMRAPLIELVVDDDAVGRDASTRAFRTSVDASDRVFRDAPPDGVRSL